MLTAIIKFLSLPSRKLGVPFAGLFLSLGISTIEAAPATQQKTEMPTTTTHTLLRKIRTLNNTKGVLSRSKLPNEDGVYLYGKAREPEQLGEEYMVFEVKDGKIVGAFYMPQSEFSCFSGSYKASGQLALLVKGYPGDVGGDTQIAATGTPTLGDMSDEPQIYPYNIALQNYHRIATVSENDQRMLATCKGEQ